MFTNLLKRTSNEFDFLQYFNQLSFNGGVELSIQASRNHYCKPKLNLTQAGEYETFEIMIIGIENIPDFMEAYDAYGVYGYVPFDVTQKLVEYCVEKYGFRNSDDVKNYFGVHKTNL